MIFKELKEGCHLLTTDLEQKHSKQVGDVKIYLTPKRTNDHRGIHPDSGTVVQSSKFEKGTTVITSHFAFEDDMFNSNSIGKIDGQDVFLIEDSQIYFTEQDGELIPVEGVLLCENLEDKFVSTFLEVPEEYRGKRRDVVKVLAPWKGCEEFKSGDYVYLGFGGDYRFEWKGREYVRVDTRRGDVFMRLNSPEWRDVNVRKHLTRDKNY